MSWKRRRPQGDPEYFCGQPPCHFCYVLVEAVKRKRKKKIPAEIKAARDLVGRKPTLEEAKVVAKSLAKLHSEKKVGVIPPILPTWDERVEIEGTALVATFMFKQLRTKKRELGPIKAATLTLDEIADKKAAKKSTKAGVLEKVKEKVAVEDT